MDSGIGLLAAAAALRRLRPEADLVLSSDPDGMPWGPRTPQDVTEHALACARAAAAHRPDALIVACNTASVHALDRIRAELEPGIPVIGTVPAIKPAAVAGGPVAIWATPATTGSAYQRDLIDRFAPGTEVHEIACPGLADAVEHADPEQIAAAVAGAAARTPRGLRGLVLGCTHYELVEPAIRQALGVAADFPMYGSARPVVEQALRRAAVAAGAPAHEPGAGVGAGLGADAGRGAVGRLTVLRSGREERLPEAALAYPEGRLLAASPVADSLTG